MEYKEEEYLQLSGLQHFSFCRRQWALIHLEMQWKKNAHTAEGRFLHEKAHDPYATEKRGNLLITRDMPAFSRTLGVSGACDVVEFRVDRDGTALFAGREDGCLAPLSINAVLQKAMMRIGFSFAVRQCVWRKCFSAQQLNGQPYTMERRAAGKQ